MTSSARSVILVVSDAVGRAYARAIAAKISASGRSVETIEREKYPVADSLPATLFGFGARSELVVVVIADSPIAKSWVAREIERNETLYPNFLLAIAPDWPQWRGHVDESSARVLAPNTGIVARIDDLLSPAPRPPTSPPIGEWVPFDPTWIVRTVRELHPGREDLALALSARTRAIWDAPFYQSFVGSKLTAAQDPTKEALVVKDRIAGLVSIHVGADGSISALGYLSRVPTREP